MILDGSNMDLVRLRVTCRLHEAAAEQRFRIAQEKHGAKAALWQWMRDHINNLTTENHALWQLVEDKLEDGNGQ